MTSPSRPTIRVTIEVLDWGDDMTALLRVRSFQRDLGRMPLNQCYLEPTFQRISFDSVNSSELEIVIGNGPCPTLR
jgi:hypothetical protein